MKSEVPACAGVAVLPGRSHLPAGPHPVVAPVIKIEEGAAPVGVSPVMPVVGHPPAFSTVSVGRGSVAASAPLSQASTATPRPLAPQKPALPAPPITHPHSAPPGSVPLPQQVSSSQVAMAGPVATSPPPSAVSPLPVPSPKPKSKPKSKAPTVTMATAATATPAVGSGPGSGGENTGRWTAEEHRLFLQGLEQHGKGWKKIASLIKTRTVVQIRTHAQKYFQKLAKARQNGDQGEISMDSRGVAAAPAAASVGIASAPPPKRRRQSSGTKRKVISGIVASAQREGKRLAEAAGGGTAPIPAVSPVLAPYVVPSPVVPQPATNAPAPSAVPSITTAHGTISGAALENSLFQFLTPITNDTTVPNAPNPILAQGNTTPATSPSPHAGEPQSLQVNDVARQAGANPIVLPGENISAPNTAPDTLSPTGVGDIGVFPSWADPKEPPAWYAKGADVDELLNEADALDWLADSGDLNETYSPPPPSTVATSIDDTKPDIIPSSSPTLTVASNEIEPTLETESDTKTGVTYSINTASDALPPVTSSATLKSVDSSSNVMPPLPSLFGSDSDMQEDMKKEKASSNNLFSTTVEASNNNKRSGSAVSMDDNFSMFDNHFDEQAFVTSLLENNGESNASFPALG